MIPYSKVLINLNGSKVNTTGSLKLNRKPVSWLERYDTYNKNKTQSVSFSLIALWNRIRLFNWLSICLSVSLVFHLFSFFFRNCPLVFPYFCMILEGHKLLKPVERPPKIACLIEHLNFIEEPKMSGTLLSYVMSYCFLGTLLPYYSPLFLCN